MTLSDTLDRARTDSVEFPTMLANHAPMVLVALKRMGASEARRAAWYEGYRASHALPAPPPPVAPLTRATWTEALGDRSRETDARAFFRAEVARMGVDACLRLYLPRLAPGMAGSALHPLMRLAYALIDGDAPAVGDALGYWVCTYLAVPRAAGGPVTSDPVEVLAGVAALPGVRDYRVEIDLLWKNIEAVSALPGFADLAGQMQPCPQAARRMARAALALYAGTMDFSALHAVTGLHWLRLLRPHVDDPEALYPQFWAVIAALVPKIGFPDLPCAETLARLRALQAPDWPEIFATACASEDEHDISLTYSAAQEEAVWGDPLYRVVAARRVGLLPC
ncbi:questin oxidase family protein [Pseudooceanicola sp. CBS1P-1]|uniref:DUF4243 domain-containing protein n=1 Tax=Pseudooceanicola albus TaxID=2692189 RepID=A0A6L7G7T3_9RHOB|nr:MULTISPECIES: questin oxidase family protein [Pseudooceanicola]MBT9385922.1 questin oxidase family protein [Pseudooceanicola endophyticus]MXN19657.1 DUF4243 domain-containing protein [Pseudooceanicola albus]